MILKILIVIYLVIAFRVGLMASRISSKRYVAPDYYNAWVSVISGLLWPYVIGKIVVEEYKWRYKLYDLEEEEEDE